MSADLKMGGLKYMRADGSAWGGFAACREGDIGAFPVIALEDAAVLSQKEAAPSEAEDAARLDFLIWNEVQVWECNGRYALHDVTEHHAITAEFSTAREAIDAARATQGDAKIAPPQAPEGGGL
jgi:hypothetical protein